MRIWNWSASIIAAGRTPPELVKEGRKANQGIPISNIAAKLFERFPQFPMIAA
jgi:hypothetical protein